MTMPEFPQGSTTYQVEPITEENIHTAPAWVLANPRKRYYIVYYTGERAVAPERHLCQEERLPEWMQYHIKVLDSAGQNNLVKEVGRKVGNTYWLGKIS
jgi:hypothetical protein